MKKMTVKRALRKCATQFSWWLQDTRDSVTGARDSLVPPRRMDHNHGFEGGEEHLAMLRDYAGLKPSDRVLDVGCGIGRVAKPLAAYLSKEGSYVGIDIVDRSVQWMRKAYAPQHPNFSFYHLDIHNSAYNPTGTHSADTVEFPFPGQEQFDVVFLFSVFTHMYPKHIAHYVKLIERQLKPGGRLFASIFINDDFAQAQQQKTIDTGEKLAKRVFRQKTDDYYAPGKTNPEFAVAFDLEQLDRLFVGTKLNIRAPFVYGYWCGRPGATSFYQDVLIATK
ncbi:MAG: methyltransferase domain-containing protein [Rhodospirillaceae bacterium]|nr:methyltransferase domain-containing protein [Rhodospirillaceae bacterium]